MAKDNNKDLSEYLIGKYRSMQQYRKPFEPMWREASQYFAPHHSLLNGNSAYREGSINSGNEDVIGRYEYIIDNTAIEAVSVCVLGMHGGTISPTQPYARFMAKDASLMDYSYVRQWLEQYTRLYYEILAQSNFYFEMLLDLTEDIVFGTAPIMVVEHPTKVIHFRSLTTGEYYISDNTYNEIDTVYRRMFFTAKEMIDLFGEDSVSKETLDVYKKIDNQYFSDKLFEVIQAIEPNTDRINGMEDNQNMPYRSIYFQTSRLSSENDKILKSNDKNKINILKMSGYRTNPCPVSRYTILRPFKYGLGRSFDLLGDVKQLQEMATARVKKHQSDVDPPMLAPEYLRDNLNTNPGEITWTNDIQGSQQILPLYRTNGDTSGVHNDILETRERIREHFFNSLFLLFQYQTAGGNPEKKVAEVSEMIAQKNILLGPVIERYISQKLNPLNKRIFNIITNSGLLPPAPIEDIRVEYVSTLAQAQRLVATQRTNMFTQYLSNIAAMQANVTQGYPEVLDNVDLDKIVRRYEDDSGAPLDFLKSMDEVKAIRQQRTQQIAQQQQAMEQQMMIEQAGQLAKIGGSVKQ